MGSIFTRTNFVTLKYVTDNWGTDTNGFKLVITAVKDLSKFFVLFCYNINLINFLTLGHTCKDYQCSLREFCIHQDLLCDGVNHCGDNSDESANSYCQSM